MLMRVRGGGDQTLKELNEREIITFDMAAANECMECMLLFEEDING